MIDAAYPSNWIRSNPFVSIFGLITAMNASDLPMLFDRLAANYRGTVKNNLSYWTKNGDPQAEIWLQAANFLEYAADELEKDLARLYPRGRASHDREGKPQRMRVRMARDVPPIGSLHMKRVRMKRD
jgi:hypothetical protein